MVAHIIMFDRGQRIVAVSVATCGLATGSVDAGPREMSVCAK
jgi:hypothetical protein